MRPKENGPEYFGPTQGVGNQDGRCPTLQDVVEFFNIILELRFAKVEKEDLVP